MTGRARTGVIVLNWNGLPHLQRCLPGLAESDHPDLFVIVVDNASSDGSAEWVRTHHPDMELLALDSNRRFAGGNNAGAARALERGAEILVLLNNDTLVEASLFSALASVFDADPRVGLAGPRIVYADDPGRIWYGGGIFHPRWGWVAHRALRRDADEGADPPGETDWVSGCCLAVRAELWRELEGLDEDFYIYAEDVDFCLRGRARGWRAVYRPEARLRHAVSASVGGQVSAFKAYHRTRSRWQLLERHGRGPWWPLANRCIDVGHALRFAALGSLPAAAAVFEAWRDRGRAPGHRVEELGS